MSNAKRSSLPCGALVVAAVLLLLTALALGGCAEPAVIAAVEPTATLYPPPTDIPPPVPGPTPESFAFPLPAPTHEEGEPVDDQNCVDCHTDKETLKAFAEEEEKPKVESEGEG